MSRARLLARAPWILLALLVAIGTARHSGFLSPRGVSVLLEDSAMLVVAALAAGVTVAAGSLDLAIGSVAALGSVTLAEALSWGWPLPAAFALALAVGALVGAIQGILVARVGLPAFLVTVAGLFGARGLAYWITPGSIPAPPAFSAAFDDGTLVLFGGYRLTPSTAIAFIATAGLAWWIARRPNGRALLAAGGDAESAALLGVDVAAIKVRAHTISGLLSALAGVIFVGVTSAGDASCGSGLELDGLAAAVIGGVVLSGGRYPRLGPLVGALVLTLLKVLIAYDGRLDAWWARILAGGLLLLAAAVARKR